MPSPSTRAVVEAAGRTFAQQAGFSLRDKPAPLFQLLVLAALLAKPIDATMATAAARELRRSGVRSPASALRTTWQQRVDALGRAHYRRFDESMATRVEQLAVFVRDTYGGDLRRLADAAHERPDTARTLLTDAPGIGPTGADIVLREAQEVWTWAAPYIDERVIDGARRLGWSHARSALVRRYRGQDAAALSAALVRVGLDDDLLASLTGRDG